MDMLSENPKIEWTQKSGKACLKFVFGEKLTLKEAEIAIHEWRDAFQSQNDAAIILIWDYRKMKGYETEARGKWTDALKEMKSQIDTIWLITESMVIKMGASVMGMLTPLNIKTVRSENEIVI